VAIYSLVSAHKGVYDIHILTLQQKLLHFGGREIVNVVDHFIEELVLAFEVIVEPSRTDSGFAANVIGRALRQSHTPRFLGRLSRNGTPITAILFSGACILTAAGLSKLTPLAYNYLFGVALFDAIIVWIIILLSHLRFRRRHRAADLPARMPGFPVVQGAGLALLWAVLITMGLDKAVWRLSWMVGVPWLALLSAAYFIVKARGGGTSAAP
jgi:L-asparagine transporter-like permease